MIWHVRILQNNVVKTSALHNAKLYADAISAFRILYTSEVVDIARRHGLKATHDYKKKKSIPLPATLSILLGEKIGQNGSGAIVSLYSPYPFPWRKDTGGLKDSFSKKAWTNLTRNPGKPYYEFLKQGDSRILRYAVADKMTQDCVGCHNNHVKSPRTNWRAGDVRGILDITLPLDDVIASTERDIKMTIAIYLALSLLGITGIVLMITRYREYSQGLENKVKLRTTQLEKKKRALDSVSAVAFEDALTSVGNRRFYDNSIKREWARALRNQQPLSIIMADIDHFKLYNDTYGHQYGDHCLSIVAAIISRAFTRATDIVCRYGGEEFVVILPDTNADIAFRLSRTLKDAVAQRELPHKSSPVADYVTISMGVACFDPGSMNLTGPSDLLSAADQALYVSKNKGRNRTTLIKEGGEELIIE